MRKVRLIGIGAGHPDQVTVEAVRALNDVDVFIVADKTSGKGTDNADLLRIRDEICARHITGDHRVIGVTDPERDRSPSAYEHAVEDWHEARAAAYEQVMRDEVADDEVVGFLVWGDPSLYDSTIRIVERILARGALTFEYDVVPGISAIQVLAARHRLVLNGIGEPITVTTGRRLREAVDEGRDNIVVVLSSRLDAKQLLEDAGAARWHIWWGANLGTADERLVAGPLEDVIGRIEDARDEVKSAHGWVMDTYLLRRQV